MKHRSSYITHPRRINAHALTSHSAPHRPGTCRRQIRQEVPRVCRWVVPFHGGKHAAVNAVPSGHNQEPCACTPQRTIFCSTACAKWSGPSRKRFPLSALTKNGHSGSVGARESHRSCRHPLSECGVVALESRGHGAATNHAAGSEKTT